LSSATARGGGFASSLGGRGLPQDATGTVGDVRPRRCAAPGLNGRGSSSSASPPLKRLACRCYRRRELSAKNRPSPSRRTRDEGERNGLPAVAERALDQRPTRRSTAAVATVTAAEVPRLLGRAPGAGYRAAARLGGGELLGESHLLAAFAPALHPSLTDRTQAEGSSRERLNGAIVARPCKRSLKPCERGRPVARMALSAVSSAARR
jgi:hypothetical protein